MLDWAVYAMTLRVMTKLGMALLTAFCLFTQVLVVQACPLHLEGAARTILLNGPPGAGKGTQAATLAQDLGLYHLSTGDLLRAEVRAGTEIGKVVGPLMSSGALVPSHYLTTLLEKKLKEVSGGILFDGYPRRLEELEVLDKLLAAVGRKIDRVINLELSEDVAVTRLGGRRVCSGCNENYHVTLQPPKTAGICDYCGKPLVQRPDDSEATIRSRYVGFRQETAPVIEELKKRGLVTSIPSANLTPDQITVQLKTLLAP